MGANGNDAYPSAAASEDVLTVPLRNAWNLRLFQVCPSRVHSFGPREISERDCIEYTENESRQLMSRKFGSLVQNSQRSLKKTMLLIMLFVILLVAIMIGALLKRIK